MLYALGAPVSFLILLVSFVVAVTTHGWVQSRVADRLGDRRPRQERRLELDPRRHLDPFGAVAAAIAGIGWALPVEVPDRRRRAALVTVALSGAAVNIALGIGLLVALRLSYGSVGAGSGAALLQRGLASSAPLLPSVLLLAGLSQLYLGVLSLVPLPPLDGGRLLFGLGPRGGGWQRAQYVLAEQNVGIAVLLALLLIPLGGPLPLLPQLLDVVLAPVLRLVTGA